MIRPRFSHAGGAAAALAAAARAAARRCSGSDACGVRGAAARRSASTSTGLKDRTGELKLELYPANEADFLKDDRDLMKEGKIFRRIRAPIAASGAGQPVHPRAAPGPLCAAVHA